MIAEPSPNLRRNFNAFLLHGVFLTVAGVFSQITTIQSSFVFALTGSSLLAGVLFAANRIGTIVPQLFLAPIIQKRRYKKLFLIAAVLIRGASWLLIAAITFAFGGSHPAAIAVAFFAITLIFFLAGGMGDVTYYDVFAKSIPQGMRGKLFGWRFFLGGVLSIGAGYWTKRILGSSQNFFGQYSLLFLLTAVSLFIAFFGFYRLQEPAGEARAESRYFRRVLAVIKSDRNFVRFIIAEFLLSASMILFPFYVIYAREVLALPVNIIGLFVTLQVIGEIATGPLLGWIGDRVNFRLVMAIVGGASFLTPVLAVVLPMLHPYAYSAIFILVGMTFKGIVLGTSNYLMEAAPAQEIPTYVAIKNTLLMPTIAFPIFGGLIIPLLGYNLLFALVAVMTLAGALLSLRLVCVRKVKPLPMRE